MIKATRSAEAQLGAEPVAKYRFALSEEHAARLDAILSITLQKPADWFAQILCEECEKIGQPAPSSAVEETTTPQELRQPSLFKDDAK